MSELPQKGTEEYALADALSRPNATNGLYRKLKLPLEWEHLNKKGAVYITHILNLADSAIEEALDNGEDLNDPKVQEKIQSAFYGGSVGASLGISYHKFLRFLGFRR